MVNRPLKPPSQRSRTGRWRFDGPTSSEHRRCARLPAGHRNEQTGGPSRGHRHGHTKYGCAWRGRHPWSNRQASPEAARRCIHKGHARRRPCPAHAATCAASRRCGCGERRRSRASPDMPPGSMRASRLAVQRDRTHTRQTALRLPVGHAPRPAVARLRAPLLPVGARHHRRAWSRCIREKSRVYANADARQRPPAARQAPPLRRKFGSIHQTPRKASRADVESGSRADDAFRCGNGARSRRPGIHSSGRHTGDAAARSSDRYSGSSVFAWARGHNVARK